MRGEEEAMRCHGRRGGANNPLYKLHRNVVIFPLGYRVRTWDLGAVVMIPCLFSNQCAASDHMANQSTIVSKVSLKGLSLTRIGIWQAPRRRKDPKQRKRVQVGNGPFHSKDVREPDLMIAFVYHSTKLGSPGSPYRWTLSPKKEGESLGERRLNTTSTNHSAHTCTHCGPGIAMLMS